MAKKLMLDPTLLDSEKYNEEKIKEAAECLLEAKEIEDDPVLMKKVQEYWKTQDGKIKSIKDLKDKANNFSNDQAEEADAE